MASSIDKRDIQEGVYKVDDIIDTSSTQYNSKIIDNLKKDGMYAKFCNTVGAMANADKSKSFMIRRLKDKFPNYCSRLNVNTFNDMIKFYPELREAFGSSLDECLYELQSLGMKKARQQAEDIDSDGAMILSLMDRLQKVQDRKEEVALLGKQGEESSIAKETSITINNVIKALDKVGVPKEVSIDSEYESEEE